MGKNRNAFLNLIYECRTHLAFILTFSSIGHFLNVQKKVMKNVHKNVVKNIFQDFGNPLSGGGNVMFVKFTEPKVCSVGIYSTVCTVDIYSTYESRYFYSLGEYICLFLVVYLEIRLIYM